MMSSKKRKGGAQEARALRRLCPAHTKALPRLFAPRGQEKRLPHPKKPKKGVRQLWE